MILALDLEFTLMGPVKGRDPRPGLHNFLAWAGERFEKVVIFSAVEESDFRAAAQELVARGKAPGWFADLDFYQAEGDIKDLRRIGDPAQTLIVDDFEEYILPEQRERWIEIEPYISEDDRNFWLRLEASLASDSGAAREDPGVDRELERIQGLLWEKAEALKQS
jgi:hypothetical protein